MEGGGRDTGEIRTVKHLQLQQFSTTGRRQSKMCSGRVLVKRDEKIKEFLKAKQNTFETG